MCPDWVGWGGQYRKTDLRTVVPRIASDGSCLRFAFTNGWVTGGGRGQTGGAWGQDPSQNWGQNQPEVHTGPWGLTSVHTDKVRGGGWGREENRQGGPSLPSLRASSGVQHPLAWGSHWPVVPRLLGCFLHGSRLATLWARGKHHWPLLKGVIGDKKL